MRLLELELSNFLSFSDAIVSFGPGTVLTGANNAGKTSLVEALEFLLGGNDRPGTWSHAELRTSGREAAEAGRPVRVVGRFGDLLPSEIAYWGPAVDEAGSLRFGSIAIPSESPGSCWNAAASIESAVLVKLNRLPSGSPRRPNGDQAIAHYIEGEVAWIGLNQFSSTVLDDGSFAGWHAPTLILIPGPESPPVEVQNVLRPLLDGLLNRKAGNALGILTQLQMQSYEVGHDVGLRLHASLRRLGIDRAHVIQMGLSGDPAVQELAATLVKFAVRGSEPDGFDSVGRAGGGSRRAVSLAALDLYCQADLWPAERPVILAIEEPEAGLHPALQRQVAATLRSLPSRGVQTVVTTHSPIFMDAASNKGIRVVREVGAIPRVVASDELEPIVAALGSRPSDVLLGEHFLVVEGIGDVVVLEAWARVLGLDLIRKGVRLVPASGADAVHLVSRLASIVYPGTRIGALFDGDPKGNSAADKMRRTFGESVAVRQWTRLSIESFFKPRAANVWARLESIRLGRPSPTPVTTIDMSVLKSLNVQLFGNENFDKVRAGEFIAGQMTRDEIDPEVVAVLAELLARPT
ncbi:MAG: AAA family ATPase [Chloroflexi bacterium]|nr:AAA family ATPase [Chloroflexota bacterium]